MGRDLTNHVVQVGPTSSVPADIPPAMLSNSREPVLIGHGPPSFLSSPDPSHTALQAVPLINGRRLIGKI